MDPILVTFLEATAAMSLLLVLHWARRFVGNPAFYLSLGLLLMLGLVVTAFDLRIEPEHMGTTVEVGSMVFVAPFLTALLVVYIVDGTVEAQRLIIGFLAVLVGYVGLTSVLANQVMLPEYTGAQPRLLRELAETFRFSRRVVASSFAASCVDLFTFPILYQFFKNRNSREFLSVAGTLTFGQVLDSLIYNLLLNPEIENWWAVLRSSYLSRATTLVWLSCLTTAYLHLRRRSNETPEDNRPTLDIVFAFLGAYARAEELQRSLREWEGRYRVVVESSEDVILLVNAMGTVININDAGRRQLGDISVVGRSLNNLLSSFGCEPCDWPGIWATLQRATSSDRVARVVRREWNLLRPGEAHRELSLDVQISIAEVEERPVAIVVARDVTENRRLQEEREALRDRLMHTQRLEDIGRLAGGVAHDFNNFLHAVQASVDSLRMCGEEEKRLRLIDKINSSLTFAARLTGQLLAFARKGKYAPQRLRLQSVIADVETLFRPGLRQSVELKTISAPRPILVRGDKTQLEQVFINLLLNARDAVLDQGSGRIVFRAEPAHESLSGWAARPEAHSAATPEEYCCVRVADNGPGIPEEIRKTMFEPFVTTKDAGKGTGMGLAMVYGAVTNHNGWIHVETEEGRGTEFFVYLPCCK